MTNGNECLHYDSCTGNHTTESSDYFCGHGEYCEKFHPGWDDHIGEKSTVGKRSPFAIFDDAKFKEDVVEYKLRQNMNGIDLAKAVGIPTDTYNIWIRSQSHLSLADITTLAAFCDLSLDSYIRIVQPENTVKIKWNK